MKQLVTAICLFILSSDSRAQGINNLWLMGYDCCHPQLTGINMDFSSGSLQISSVVRNMNYGSISVTMCDSLGALLFSTNAVYISNATGDTMVNGAGLSPSYYSDVEGYYGLLLPQAALAIAYPGAPNRYLLFHGSVDDSIQYLYAFKFYYSEIDMQSDSGRGAVVSKNNALLTDTLVAGHIIAVKHANGRDWWVVVHQGKTNKYFIFMVDPTGVHLYSSPNIGSVRTVPQGQAVFSPDGSKFAFYDTGDDLDIMDFDRCTGTFSNLVHVAINDSASSSGVAFSPDSKVLYVSSQTYIYQFDLQAANIPASMLTVATWDGYYSPSPPAATLFYLAQLAPDGKIYISCSNGTLDMHVINYPDSIGLACDVCQHCIHLPGFNGSTMPNSPNYFLGQVPGSVCDSVMNFTPELISPDQVHFFPNPVNDYLYVIPGKKKQNGELKILDLLGRPVSLNINYVDSGDYIYINVSRLTPGVYLLINTTDSEIVIGKFVKE